MYLKIYIDSRLSRYIVSLKNFPPNWFGSKLYPLSKSIYVTYFTIIKVTNCNCG